MRHHVEWPRADRSIRKSPSFLQTLFAAQSHGVLSVASRTSPRLWARMCVKALRFCAMRVARTMAAGPCIEMDHSSTCTLVPPTPHPTPRDLRFWRTWAHCEGGARVAGSRDQATLPDAKLDIPRWDVAARRAVCFQQAPRAPTRLSASSCGLIFFVGNMNAL